MVVDHLLKTRKELKDLKKQEIEDISIGISQTKPFFQHDMVYGYCKNLHKSAAVEKIVHDKAFNIAKNSDYDGYQRGIHIFWMTHFWIKSGQVVVLLKVKIY